MPKKGYITIGTKVTKEDHDKLVKITKEKETSINKLIGEIIERYLNENRID